MPPCTLPPTARHWSDPLWRWRDRLLSDPRFQHAAQRAWPTRWIARRRAAALFDLMAGFVYSQVLTACVQLDLFALIGRAGPQTLASLASHCDLSTAATERLVRAAVALRLLQDRPGGRIGLGALGAPMVGNAGLAALVRHHAPLYGDLADPLALLRRDRPCAGDGAGGGAGDVSGDIAAQPRASTGLAAYWPYAAVAQPSALPAQDVAAYSDLMALSQPWVAQQILDAYPLRRHHRLLDVGGGAGVFACLAAAAAPQLQVAVFDLPAVADRARLRFAQAGLGERAQAFGGDFHQGLLPAGADLVTLIRVTHDHDDDRVQALLAAVWRALPPGGVLLLAEPLADTPGARAMGDAYFGLYLWAMGQGRPRRFDQLRSMLLAAGFADVQLLATDLPLQTRLIQARVAAGKPPVREA